MNLICAFFLPLNLKSFQYFFLECVFFDLLLACFLEKFALKIPAKSAVFSANLSQQIPQNLTFFPHKLSAALLVKGVTLTGQISDGIMVRALTSHQSGLGFITRPNIMCRLSLLLVLVLATKGISPGFSLGSPKTNTSKFQFDQESKGQRFVRQRLSYTTLNYQHLSI